MIPTTNETLAQLVNLWHLENDTEPVEPITMSKLASDLMYPPIFIINAMDLGIKTGVLEYDNDTDEVRVVGDLETTHMGKEVQQLANAIEDKVTHENNNESDISLGILQNWCMGVRPSAVRLALKQLTDSGVLAEYRLADPKDEDSVYDFYTRSENKDKQWGKKQFKESAEQ